MAPAAPDQSPCRRLLVIKDARLGSSWFTSMLNEQPGTYIFEVPFRWGPVLHRLEQRRAGFPRREAGSGLRGVADSNFSAGIACWESTESLVPRSVRPLFGICEAP
eukprot:gnl/TRDRNA2_/TRDRNA2_145212_c0_seq2.p1 gnl/TRDRNA2_/TRDRNA2_145212_c0~~gnl/TRDRNA2_/TRDRNA2_145212_c0_seq2.p1  ORF type:complete len:106 (+),score=1.36 gnl/TRDRNA2_/TRDRNA2_145212_c0_seq2:81-398(+)